MQGPFRDVYLPFTFCVLWVLHSPEPSTANVASSGPYVPPTWYCE